MLFIQHKTQMKKLTIIALVAAFGFVSCKDANKESNTTDTTTETPAPVNETVPAADAHDGHDHSHDGHDHSHGAETAQGMNPPHGEPGHRCDIPVGAPLNSAPTQPNASTPANSGGQGFLGNGDAQAPAQPASQQQFSTAPGMQGQPNPAHGQPGHRCDIQVGQPLP